MQDDLAGKLKKVAEDLGCYNTKTMEALKNVYLMGLFAPTHEEELYDYLKQPCISIIVAVSENGVIGKDNKLLWRQSADLKRFKELTNSKSVIMGRKTYESIGKPLPNRRNIVITRQDIEIPGCEVVKSTSEAIKLCRLEPEIFILGGGEVYKQFIEIADYIYFTRIHTNIEGDTYFRELDLNQWHKERDDFYAADEKNEFNYSFIDYYKEKF